MIISNNEVIVMAKKEKAKVVETVEPVNEQVEQEKLEASLDVINLEQNETLNSFSEKLKKDVVIFIQPSLNKEKYPIS